MGPPSRATASQALAASARRPSRPSARARSAPTALWTSRSRHGAPSRSRVWSKQASASAGSTTPGVQPAQTGQVARRHAARATPPVTLREHVVGQDTQQQGEGHHVLSVVLQHLGEQLGIAGPQPREVALGDEGAGQVVVSAHAADARLHAGQPGIRESMAPDLACHAQQVQVRGIDRWWATMQPIPAADERPVEGPAVVAHERRVRRQMPLQHLEQRRLVRVVGQQQLADHELVALPAAERHQERHRAGGRAQTRWSRCRGRRWAGRGRWDRAARAGGPGPPAGGCVSRRW